MTQQDKVELLSWTYSRLDNVGWIQGKLGGKNGPNSLYGAVLKSEARGLFLKLSPRPIEAFARLLGFLTSEDLIDWEDVQGRTIWDVLEILTRAILRVTNES
jgi:hypothetical protein